MTTIEPYNSESIFKYRMDAWDFTHGSQLALVFRKEVWQSFRDAGIDLADFTDEELENYNTETGLIGVKMGIHCYIQKEL